MSPRPDSSEFTLARSDRQLAAIHDEITSFIVEAVATSGAEGVVVNLDGGVDSTLTATLAVESLGADRVSGLILPCNLGTEAAAHDAEAVSRFLGIDSERIHLQPLLNVFMDQLLPQVGSRGENVALGNVIARLRMLCVYFVANTTTRLVLGTTNRTEFLLGYFTKYGDGGVDLLPIGDLYETEVVALARRLDVPEFILEKPSRPGIWAGRTDWGELGAPPEIIDGVLHCLVEGMSPEEITAALDADRDVIERLAARYADSGHKRRYPPTPSVHPE